MTIEYTYPSQYPRFGENAWAEATASLKQTTELQTAQHAEESSFFDHLLDTINPLQQLPIIGTLYRHLTGDTISPVSRMAGGALFGGPIGFVVSAVNAALEDGTGKDAGEHLIAMVSGGSETSYASSAYQKASVIS